MECIVYTPKEVKKMVISIESKNGKTETNQKNLLINKNDTIIEWTKLKYINNYNEGTQILFYERW